MLLCVSRGSDDISVAAILGLRGGVLAGLLLVCGQDGDGPVEMERASSYEVTPGRSGVRPGTAGESFEGQRVRGSRLPGQAVPGDLGVSRRPGGGEGGPRGRRNASGSG
jgi:hypothetical protein